MGRGLTRAAHGFLIVLVCLAIVGGMCGEWGSVGDITSGGLVGDECAEDEVSGYNKAHQPVCIKKGD